VPGVRPSNVGPGTAAGSQPARALQGRIESVSDDPNKKRTAIDTDRPWGFQSGSALQQYGIAVGVVLLVSLANFFLGPLVGVHATALIFLLAVVVLALFVERGPTLVAATLSAVLWDYFWLPPVFAFRVTTFEDGILLGTYFVVALVLGQLTARIRAQERAKRQGEEHATALYLLTREIAGAADLDGILQRVVQQMKKTFEADAALLLPDTADRERRRLYSGSTLQMNDTERDLATWAFIHGCPTRSTSGHPRKVEPEAVFLPLATKHGKLGVLAVRPDKSARFTVPQRQLLDAFAQQIALAMDRHRLQQESETAKVLEESERLSKTLLDSVSHEIRTPVAAIKGAIGNLLEVQELSESQQEIVAEIQEANERLDRLVGKVLDITRLESGHVKPRMTPCDVTDLIHIALKETKNDLRRHKVGSKTAPKLPLVEMDFVLMQQALMNLLSNAAVHTPLNSSVEVGARIDDGALLLTVQDSGLGIAPECIPRVFDKFYRGPNAPTGGTGLGLSLVKGFVEAQGGQVGAANRPQGGAIFTIRMPLEQDLKTPLPSA